MSCLIGGTSPSLTTTGKRSGDSDALEHNHLLVT